MPAYLYRCNSCGEQFDVVKRMALAAQKETCPACEQFPAQRLYTSAGIAGGDRWAGGKHFKQLGRSFESVREMEAFCDKEGLIPVAGDGREWREVRDKSKEAGETEAKAAGYRDAEDRNKFLKDNHRDSVAAAREEHIKAYHDEHGSAGARSADDAEVWGGDALPEGKIQVGAT